MIGRSNLAEHLERFVAWAAAVTKALQTFVTVNTFYCGVEFGELRCLISTFRLGSTPASATSLKGIDAVQDS